MRHFTNISQLRLFLALFFLALAVPSVILVRQAYSQLKWESFHQYRSQAQELSARIDNSLVQLISAEEDRTFADYSFLVVSGSLRANYLQPSPLSRFPVEADIPGLVGYFQLDARGQFNTPILPHRVSQAAGYGISPAQLLQRQHLQERIQRILSDNQLVQPRSAEGKLKMGATLEEVVVTAVKADETAAGATELESRESGDKKVAAQDVTAGFERFKDSQYAEQQQQKLDSLSSYGRVEDLNLASSVSALEKQQRKEAGEPVASVVRAVRKERSALPTVQAPAVISTEQPADRDDSITADVGSTRVEITMFESEIDPFDFALLDSGHFVMYRNTWRDSERVIQGAIIEQQQFLRGVIEPLFRETSLSQMSDLAVAYQGSVFAAFGGVSGRDYLSQDYGVSNDNSSGELLYQSRLSAPFSDLELFYSINHLPASRGAIVIGWAALVLAIVVLGGLLLMYRLGLRQIALAQQQQDFVSSISHELKTPLTSIRMYSEMLREGWVDTDKRKSYYDFIFDESERLSRLIANVLQLARMDREDIPLDSKPVSMDTLFDTIRSKLTSQVESAGFTMTLTIEDSAVGAMVMVDRDCFTQILINLVDNAIKFSSKSATRAVDISARLSGSDEVVIAVRDYGPGVPSNQMKKIFRLFYRLETELTRETVGTGIGLALVHQQVQAMGGKVDVLNREPGAEFSVTLPRA